MQGEAYNLNYFLSPTARRLLTSDAIGSCSAEMFSRIYVARIFR
jgi:hypothetical protein